MSGTNDGACDLEALEIKFQEDLKEIDTTKNGLTYFLKWHKIIIKRAKENPGNLQLEKGGQDTLDQHVYYSIHREGGDEGLNTLLDDHKEMVACIIGKPRKAGGKRRRTGGKRTKRTKRNRRITRRR